MKFYECRHCGNIMTYQREVALTVYCCDRAMQEMEPNTADASGEKHPMENEHHIQWIILETSRGYHKRHLQPGGDPAARFTLQNDEEIRSAYEFCNMHGLWKSARQD